MKTGERMKEFRDRYGISFRAMRAFCTSLEQVRRISAPTAKGKKVT